MIFMGRSMVSCGFLQIFPSIDHPWTEAMGCSHPSRRWLGRRYAMAAMDGSSQVSYDWGNIHPLTSSSRVGQHIFCFFLGHVLWISENILARGLISLTILIRGFAHWRNSGQGGDCSCGFAFFMSRSEVLIPRRSPAQSRACATGEIHQATLGDLGCRSSPDCCTTLKIQSHNMIGSFNNFHICINRLQVWTYVQRARSNAWTIPGSIVLRADFMVHIWIYMVWFPGDFPSNQQNKSCKTLHLKFIQINQP